MPVKVDVDVPMSRTVVIVRNGDGERYHRQSNLPWREFACPSEVAADTAAVPRLEAEQRGYEPCTRPDCFGQPE